MTPGATGMRPQRFQRERNLKLVMNALREGGPASRSTLASALHLDRSTLTHLAGALLEAGLIVEADELSASAKGGRRPRPLSLNPDGYAAAGIDIRADDAEWTLARLDGSVRDGGVIERGPGLAPGEWMRDAAGTFSDLLARMGGASLRLLGIGVSVPGIVNPRTGLLIRSVALEANGVSIPELWRVSGLPVTVDNDAKCCAWNLADEKGVRENTILCQIKLHRSRDGVFHPSGAGVGLAFLLNGRLLYGRRSETGELRGPGWKRNWPDQFGLELGRIQAEQGAPQALRELTRAVLENLSVVVAAIVPDRVVLTGDVGELSGAIPDLLASDLAGSVMSHLHSEGALSVLPAADLPASLGAARLVLARHFRFSVADGGNPHGGIEWQAVIGSVGETLTPRS